MSVGIVVAYLVNTLEIYQRLNNVGKCISQPNMERQEDWQE